MLIDPLVLPQDGILLKRPVIDVRRSVVQILTHRRNAWHRTMINKYDGDAAIFSDFASAEDWAESSRTAGTYFEIEELPAIVFDLGQRSIVIVHLNSSAPFKAWRTPAHLVEPRTRFTGSSVYDAFNIEESVTRKSGWPSWGKRPTLIMGTVTTVSLSAYKPKRTFYLAKSYFESGFMYFRQERQLKVNVSHLTRITNDTKPLVRQPLRVHEAATYLHTTTGHCVEMLANVGKPAKGARSWVDPDTLDTLRTLMTMDGI